MARGELALLRQPVVHYGAPIGDVLPALVAERGSRRVLPVVTGSLEGNASVRAALEAIGAQASAPFSRLRPHTPFEVVLSLAEEIERVQPDLIVVVGGGSALDAAKIAGLAAASGARDRQSLLDLRALPGARGEMKGPSVSRTMAVAAVPTTLSGAEFGVIGGATDVTTGVKHLYRSETLAPEIVVFDPWLSTATPLDLWVSTGIRALDHAVETVLSRDANPYTDALALRGIALLNEGLRAARADAEDVQARSLGQMGVWLSACGIGRVRYGASHGLGHQLGAIAGVPHGMTSCVLLPAVLAFNEPVSRERQRVIADALGRPGLPASDAVRDLIASLGLPTRLSELEVDREALRRVAESALGNAFVKANLRPLDTVSDVMAILETAF